MPNEKKSTSASQGSAGSEEVKVELTMEEIEAKVKAKLEELSAIDATIEERKSDLAMLEESLAKGDEELKAKAAKVEELDAQIDGLESDLEDLKEEHDLLKDLSEKAAEKKAAEMKIGSEGKEVTVSFAAPAFRMDGKEYKSVEVEKAAAAAEAWALELITKLIAKKSGVITIIEGGE